MAPTGTALASVCLALVASASADTAPDLETAVQDEVQWLDAFCFGGNALMSSLDTDGLTLEVSGDGHLATFKLGPTATGNLALRAGEAMRSVPARVALANEHAPEAVEVEASLVMSIAQFVYGFASAGTVLCTVRDSFFVLGASIVFGYLAGMLPSWAFLYGAGCGVVTSWAAALAAIAYLLCIGLEKVGAWIQRRGWRDY